MMKSMVKSNANVVSNYYSLKLHEDTIAMVSLTQHSVHLAHTQDTAQVALTVFDGTDSLPTVKLHISHT